MESGRKTSHVPNKRDRGDSHAPMKHESDKHFMHQKRMVFWQRACWTRVSVGLELDTVSKRRRAKRSHPSCEGNQATRNTRIDSNGSNSGKNREVVAVLTAVAVSKVLSSVSVGSSGGDRCATLRGEYVGILQVKSVVTAELSVAEKEVPVDAVADTNPPGSRSGHFVGQSRHAGFEVGGAPEGHR